MHTSITASGDPPGGMYVHPGNTYAPLRTLPRAGVGCSEQYEHDRTVFKQAVTALLKSLRLGRYTTHTLGTILGYMNTLRTP